MSEEEQEPQGSETAGGCMLLAVSTGLGFAVYNISRDLLVIVVWVIGTALIGRACRNKVQRPVNSAPPAPSKRGCEEEPQVTVMRDKTHPNRWVITKRSRWMNEEIDKES